MKINSTNNNNNLVYQMLDFLEKVKINNKSIIKSSNNKNSNTMRK